MRLKGIELQGFKSFPDRTKLDFGDGITAIVGPNGSGKSNISDAVRWVFGEQSSKTLRGNKMEDVIFGGTVHRKAQGFAWVSLFIDNSDHSLPVESSEVIITRKLYRSGESEYRINNQLVRLRDVTELFLDTGLGRDGYSIIGQGKIAEIVSAKSTQRREIFEEAAGIAKFRLRKTEAERRLEAAEENLVRLRDILGELESRVEPLRVQSEKAAQFLVLAEEKKLLEISLWVHSLQKLKGQIKEQEDKLLICKNDHEAVQHKLEEIEQEAARIYRDMQDITIYIDNRRSVIKELEESLSKAESDIAVMENDILHNTQNAQRLEKEVAGADSEGSQLQNQIEQKQQELAEKEQTVAARKAEMDHFFAGLEQTRQEQTALSSQIDGLQAQRDSLHQSISQAKMTNASSATLMEDAISRIEQLRSSSEQKDQNLTRIQKELQDCEAYIAELAEKINGLQNAAEGYTLKLESRQQRLRALEQEQQGYDAQAGQLLQRAQLLSDMEQNMEGFVGSVKYVMKQARHGGLMGVIGPVSTLLSTNEQYATAIEIALGAAMQNIVVENETAAKRAISMLVNSKSGRATFLPLTTIKGSRLQEPSLAAKPGYVGLASELVRYEPRYAGIVDWLLGRIIVAENLDLAVEIAKSCNYRYRVVTLDGQVVNTGGSLTGGYLAKSAGILGRHDEIDRLRQQAAEFTAKSKEMEARIEQESRELSALSTALAGIEAERKTATEDSIAAAAERKRLVLSYEEALQAHRQSKQDYDQLCARMEELKTQNLSSAEAVEKLTAQLQAIEQELLTLTQRRVALTESLEKDAVTYSEMQLEFVSQCKDLEQLNHSLELLVQQREGQGQRLNELRAQIEEYQKQNEDIKAAIEARRQQNAQERERITALYQEIEQSNARRLACEQQNTALRQTERELTAQRERVAAELVRLEERYTGMKSEYDATVAKLWDEHEISKSQAVEMAMPLEDPGAASRRLNELKGKIKSLGTVNLGAIEEYKEVSERYTFLKAQIEDVEKSKAELGRIITDLTGEMCRIFADKFASINEHFSRIFVELFGGGKARLTLTNPEDLLESGIDIFVQPPGKLIKNLTALSGGEQAFVAIAIYFAILKVSPAPFVLIDEIEAALDDVNVTKFASYLRRMTKRTQFIAITHRRGTMEEADVLYGVTMQEEGVSKILKLDVSEIESKLGTQLR